MADPIMPLALDLFLNSSSDSDAYFLARFAIRLLTGVSHIENIDYDLLHADLAMFVK